MSRDEIIASLLEMKPELTERGVKHMAIYGSRARGDESSNSDLDLLVDIDRQSRFSLLDLIGIEHLVGDALGIPAHASVNSGLEPGFARRIKRDLVEIF